MIGHRRPNLAAAVARGESIVLVRQSRDTQWLVASPHDDRPDHAGATAHDTKRSGDGLLGQLKRWLTP